MPPNQEPEAGSKKWLFLEYFPDNTLWINKPTLDDIRATMQLEQNKTSSAAPYIVSSDTSPETVEYITNNPQFLGKHVRIFYDKKYCKLVIKLVHHAHEVARSLISREIDIAADRMSIVNGLVPDGSKRVASGQYTKEPASSWRPATLPPSRDAKWPSLVVECGDLKSITRLRIEAEWWLAKSQGDVKVAIVLIVWPTWSGILLEKWVPDPNGDSNSNDSATGTAKCIQKIGLQCKARNTASVEISGGSLRLGFEEVFLRAPSSPRERDIIVSEEALKSIMGLVYDEFVI
ncbi:hypothetical protein SI65_07877 [Aspergillus cristatus]|uniref:Uncharacterized protein n=1 Tax=Aspergillus cristatus TaxID=573508 RepID=A0A1E3B7G5_ASPCR|nr:hypothetical protein SI65_07877 [Aspergillus cristatus]